MELNKFEKHIKDKLKDREIAPSTMAWDKIQRQLQVEEKKRTPFYVWIGVAASVVVVLGMFFMNYEATSDKDIEPIQVVKTSDNKEVIKNEQDKISVKKNNFVVATEEILDKPVKENAPLKKKSNISLATQEVEEPKFEKEIIDVHKTRIVLNSEKENKVLTDSLLDVKIAEVLVEVNRMEQSAEITDAEVDSLLLKAQQDILREPLFASYQTVNAMALLTEVEEELDQSFREQIFNKLKTGFLKVRTAVADRNN
ncbi:hypothetical protein ACOCEA_11555 [Maribacter sp. CXY002]|uniref:hypothetical protein n=1 Tax=Maribacter luteocoastalis TaxID=3407671 RepID=UPI003B6838D6